MSGTAVQIKKKEKKRVIHAFLNTFPKVKRALVRAVKVKQRETIDKTEF